MRWFVWLLCLLWVGAAMAGEVAGQKVVAIVGEDTITQADVDEFTRNIPEPFKSAFELQVLERLIDTKTFGNEALKQGLDKSPEFAARLQKEKPRILADFFVQERIEKQVKVTPKEVEAYYLKHKNEFQVKEMVKIAQISVKTSDEAEAVKARLAKGESFETLVKEHAANSGSRPNQSTRWLQRGKAPAPLEEAAFTLKNGEVSDVLQSRDGFHVIRVLDKREAGVKSLAEARPMIERKLKLEKVAVIKDEYKKKAGVKVVDSRYQKIPSAGLKP